MASIKAQRHRRASSKPTKQKVVWPHAEVVTAHLHWFVTHQRVAPCFNVDGKVARQVTDSYSANGQRPASGVDATGLEEGWSRQVPLRPGSDEAGGVRGIALTIEQMVGIVERDEGLGVQRLFEDSACVVYSTIVSPGACSTSSGRCNARMRSA
jgi:hypothetical protein